MYEYNAQCVKVVDGDTYDFEVDLGFDITHKIRVRLAVKDAPETRGKSPLHKEHGKQATAFCKDMLLGPGVENFPEARPLQAPTVCIKTYKDETGKYGRYVAEVWFLGEDGEPTDSLGDLLEAAGLLKKDSYPDEV